MKIGDVTLDRDMLWSDEYQNTYAAGTADRTIYGNLVVQNYRTYSGGPLTLEGTSTTGWQRRETVKALFALFNTNPAATVVIEMPDGTTVNGQFRNEEPPVLSFQQVTPASAPDNDFWYYGTIKMRVAL